MNTPHPEPSQEETVLLRLPDLRLVRMVGQGAYGQVWLAINEITQKLLAVKIIPLVSSDNQDRVGREIASLIRYEAAARKQHENLLAIDHVGQTSDRLYYLMDLADDVTGRPASADDGYQPATLALRLKSGSIPFPECLKWARQLLAGLACLHKAGLAHRDVKPENCVFVGGKLKLADFGLLTNSDGTASLVGTPMYMPPDGQMNARADVYAAGLVIYEMMTGLPASNFPRWGTQAAPRPRDPILCGLNQIILKACQPDSRRRFEDAAAMLHALETTVSKAQQQGTRRRTFLLAGGTCVAAIVVLALLAGSRLWLGHPKTVDVNFITIPYEADVYLNGIRAVDPQGKPYKTPCTIIALPARTHRVTFRLQGLPDLDSGNTDFSVNREVLGEWQASGPRHRQGPP